jgi:hypothetical protein
MMPVFHVMMPVFHVAICAVVPAAPSGCGGGRNSYAGKAGASTASIRGLISLGLCICGG